MPQKKTKKKRAKVVVPKLNNVSCPSTQLGVNSLLRINFYHNGIHIYPQAC